MIGLAVDLVGYTEKEAQTLLSERMEKVTAGAPKGSARASDKSNSPPVVGQIVPYADAGPLSAKLLKNGTLKTYKGFPHGMPTTEVDTINADLLAFIGG